MDTGAEMKNKKKYHIDTVSLNYPKKDMDIDTYMKDGMIENWDMFEKVLDYSYKKIIQSESEYHPVLFSESAWNKKDRREKICEIMFEKYNVPAFFLVKNAVLAAFANGRSTGLVVDSGATHTSAIPVHDGYVLQHAIVKSPLGADFLTNQCQQFLQEQKVNITCLNNNRWIFIFREVFWNSVLYIYIFKQGWDNPTVYDCGEERGEYRRQTKMG